MLVAAIHAPLLEPRCSLQGVAARPGWCCGLPARLPLPVRLTRSRPTVSGEARRCSVWLARHPAMHPARRRRGWAWGRVSMFTISGYSCTTYRAAFSSYTYLTEPNYNTVTSLAMKLESAISVQSRTEFTVIKVRERDRFRLARGGAPAAALVGWSSNGSIKPNCEPRCAANSRARSAAERMPRVSEVGSDDHVGSPMRRMKPIEAQAASCKLSQTAETCAA